tara:strand:- start:601 stop:984 length:384 start_codon:yes stop_codon:yes gene_type:complete
MLGEEYVCNDIPSDPRFEKGFLLFNSCEWYLAHDIFEEIWHETYGTSRQTIQAILQVAVAHVHLQNGNTNGATILLGESLGRLKKVDIPNLGIDIELLRNAIEERLKLLQAGCDPYECDNPVLYKLV